MRIEDLLPDRYHAAGHWLREHLPPMPFQRGRFRRKVDGHPPLVIFQMGKVGSRSLFYGIKPSYSGVTLHTHNFSGDDANWRTRFIYSRSTERAPVNVISITRDPINQSVSAFFQNFRRITGRPYRKSRFSLAELKEQFLNRHPHHMPLRWFDNKLRPALGIDVFATDFPARGYQSYTHENIRLLVIRCELQDEEKVAVVSKFLGVESFEICVSNASERKSYGEDYGRFLGHVKLPTDYLDRICNSKYFRHFYEPAYIQAVRKKWSEC